MCVKNSVHRGVGVSVPACTTGHMTGGSLFTGVSGEVSVQRGLCPGGPLSRGVSVQGGLCLGGLCSGWGSLSSGVSVRETPVR